MNFYTISTFRDVIASLLKKPREGYSSVVTDICNELQSMPDNIIRDSNIPNTEYIRLQMELINESLAKQLHQVDIANGLSELSTNGCLPASV